MKHISVAVIISLISAVVLFFTNFSKDRTIVYDCGMAEWHPDIPAKVKEECRRLQRELRMTREKEVTT